MERHPALDVELTDLEGRPARLGDHLGDPLIVFIWASWWRCREQLPVWQHFWDERPAGRARFVTIAADADLEKAAQFAGRVPLLTTLVDRENELARIFGYRAIPNGFAFGADGALIGSKIPGFDIRDTASRELVEGWLATPADPSGGADELAGQEPATEALDLFAQGSRLMREGDRTRAVWAWARAFEKDPKNFVIRKQIWRALYPDRFGDPIDLAWQKEQMAREDAEGFLSANPGVSRASG